MDWLRLSTLRLRPCARAIFVTLAALSAQLVLPAGSQAEVRFPYIAYVSSDGVYTRSGPGQRYYPTGQLPQGYAVEVYRHDQPGWCAVRPPENSFSWLAAHEVRLVDGQVAEVVADQAVARVGSTVSPARSAVQVMVPKGERVKVLAAGANDDPRWLRITAPAGEFRWVAARHLSLRPPVEANPPRQPARGWGAVDGHTGVPTRSGNQARVVPGAPGPPDFDHLRDAPPMHAGQTLGTAFRAPPRLAEQQLPDPDAMEVIAGSPAEMQLAQHQTQAQDSAPLRVADEAMRERDPVPSGTDPVAEPAVPRVRLPDLTATLADSSENVADLDLLLSQMVARPPRLWDLGPLQTKAEGLLESADSTAQRVRLRDLERRIARFRRVQQEYQQPHQRLAAASRDPFGSAGIGAPGSSPAGASGTPDEDGQLSRLVENVRQRVREDLRNASRNENAAIGSPGAAEKPLYDAVGRLKPVVSRREQAPPYALVDGKGRVVSFVTPTPDLNLQPYIGRHVGVHGNRGFMPEYRKAHVTAGRVSPIEGRLR